MTESEIEEILGAMNIEKVLLQKKYVDVDKDRPTFKIREVTNEGLILIDF